MTLPYRDPRANYDHRGGLEDSSLADDLSGLVDGDVRFDAFTRSLFATDASIYAVTPIGVVFPRSTKDVAAAVEYCADRDVPVLPRGGGTSLAGQTVNEAVVLDFSRYMDGFVAFDPDGCATAQPGITLGDLNRELEPHDVKFAPDPAWGDKSALGGAIGNNSTGAHSLVYGKTDAYVESCEVVLADGTVTRFGEVALEALRAEADPDGDLEARIYAEVARIVEEDTDEIEAQYPDLKRNVSGYNLDRLVADAASGSVNLARLLAGSEGTLAVVTEATVALEPVPETTSLALLAYESRLDAMTDVAPVLEFEPSAVEVMDDVFLERARETAEFASVAAMLPEGTDTALLVEFYADDDAHGRQQVADLLADRVPSVDLARTAASGATLAEEPVPDRHGTDAPVRAFDALSAHDDATQTAFWKLRKAGLPILLSRTTDEKHVAFIEDTAVPPERLPEFVERFEAILDEHDTFASFYAHAGPGVLHVRPLVTTKTEDGVADLHGIADAATDLVVEFDGSVSGEHGDGRARTQWNRKLYGDATWETFTRIKETFDPQWLLNPGQVVGLDADAEPARARTVDVTEHLRFDPEYDFDADFEPALEWSNPNGFQGMVELCHGCAGCRGNQDVTGGVMCPTYRAAHEEITSTRGRANMLRHAMNGDLPAETLFTDEFFEEVLELCVGCKGCKMDCPSGVDMAKLKTELTHARHQRTGSRRRDRLFANIEWVSRLGSATAPVSNWLPRVPGARRVLEAVLGIARERSLPSFTRQSFRDWADARADGRDPDWTGTRTNERDRDWTGTGTDELSRVDADHSVVLVTDPYTTYSDPAPAKAAVRVLEAVGVHVDVPGDVTDTGRPAFSKGFIETARATAAANVDVLADRVAEGQSVVCVEPSDAVMLQSDYRDLLTGPDVDAVAQNTYGVFEYLDVHDLTDALAVTPPETSLTYHGHCHQKATATAHHVPAVLRAVGFTVDVLDSGCCGMSGAFGYEAEHYSMSRAIGRILFRQVDESPGETVVAPGVSCRTQLGDRYGADAPLHPIEVLAAHLA